MKHFSYLIVLISVAFSLMSFSSASNSDEPSVLIASFPAESYIQQKVDAEVKKIVEPFKGGVSYSNCKNAVKEYKYLFNAQIGTNYSPQYLESISEKLKNMYPKCTLKTVSISESGKFCTLQ